ncbi:ribbon-helix-helix protein, CopG family [Nitrososphaera sp. AFS]|nr:ribbon-helix-helix protein, CopG family [Nitrososphaera sp. AFS]
MRCHLLQVYNYLRQRNKLDEIKNEKHYSSRSEVIRDAIRAYLSEYEISNFEKGNLTANPILLFGKRYLVQWPH